MFRSRCLWIFVEIKRESKSEAIKIEGNKPEKRFSAGAISATVWQNKGHDKFGNETLFRTVSFQRRYKDKEDNWQTSSSLRVNDLPKAMVVLSEAYKYLLLKVAENTAPVETGEQIGKGLEDETAGQKLGPEVEVEEV